MPRLSVYKSGYDEGQEELKRWQFWTDEERSFVIYNGYKHLHLSSDQVAPYLTTSRMHSITQWVGPLTLVAVYQLFLKKTVFSGFYRKSPYIGLGAGTAFLGVSTLLWLNLSPFYIAKEQGQQKLMQNLFDKLGARISSLNGMLPRLRTSTQIDRRTRKLYTDRNSSEPGKFQQDIIPPILTRNAANTNPKKTYL